MLIHNFSKVDDNIYRGGAPTSHDIMEIHKKYGIDKVISLDEKAGENIRDICKKLKIKHIEIPIKSSIDKKTINKILNVLSDIDSPTYVHCRWGKDRTGMVIAMYRCTHGKNIKEAFKEASKFHFGRGLPETTVNNYIKAVKYVYNLINDDSDDKNEIIDDVVSEQRNDFDKGFINPAYDTQQSFAPYLDSQTIYAPYASDSSSYTLAKNYFDQIIKTSKAREDQFDSEEKEKLKNYNKKNKLKKLLIDLLRYIDSEEQISSIESKEDSYQFPPNNVPQIGQYDNYSGVKGSGPTETGGYAQL